MKVLEYRDVDPTQVLHLNLLSLSFALTPERVELIRRLDPRAFPLITQFRVRRLLLATFSLLFGLQIFRVFLPLLFWYLGRSLNAHGLALYALATFSLTLLAPLIRGWLGEPGSLALCVGGLALVRLGIQLARSPLADLALATAGLALLGWFLPVWCQSRRNCLGPRDVPLLAVSFPLAFLLDTGSRTLLLSYDLAWRDSLGATLVTIGLVVATLFVLWGELGRRAASAGRDQRAEEPSFGWVLPLLGLGPWLYVALTISHNPAALSAATGWGYNTAHVAMLGFTAVGTMASIWVACWSALQRWYWAVFGGILLVGGLAFLAFDIGPGWLWVGLVSLNSWAALGEVLTSTARREPLQPGLWRTGLVIFLALVTMLVMVILVTGYDLLWMTPLAGVILGLAALRATRAQAWRDGTVLRAQSTLVGAVAAGVLLTVGGWSLFNRPGQIVEIPAPGEPLRIMTYNIHHGIDADLSMNLDAIAAVIAEQNPDVVVLNEVNRARLTNGFVDTLPLISRRMKMRHVFGANHPDGQYGNAILSRFPILEWDNVHYQAKTTEVRGLLRAVIRTAGDPITFYGTHLDHIKGPLNVRNQQVMEALEEWAGNARSILLGDLNAEPDAPELQPIYQAGLVDALAVVGAGNVFTAWEKTPSRRIDFIFQTPDLPVKRAWVVESRASDHLPVLSELIP